MNSYWKVNDKKFENTEKVQKCIDEQCQELNKITNGNVKAIFQPKRENVLTITQKTVSSINNIFTNEKERKAYDLIANKEYEFYITDKNNEYEFPIFTISMNNKFPINLILDNSLAYELLLNEKYKLDSYKEFDNLFREILQSNRITYIIEQLNQL